MVKIIMSKFEVLQSNRVQEEKRVLEKYSLIAHMANHRMTPYIHYFFRIPGLFLSFFRL
ncbi:MAG: hypothetical protein H6767_08195 [Candidatus Peribacteria bacterium]|nr:MAG: hypothetical protein H6767_08195 [Candidatus Peribacteria bacterium]